MPVKPFEDALPFLLSPLTEIAQVEDDPILGDRVIPSADEFLIHLCGRLEGPATETDDVVATEMGIGREPKVLAGKPKDSILAAHGLKTDPLPFLTSESLPLAV